MGSRNRDMIVEYTPTKRPISGEKESVPRDAGLIHMYNNLKKYAKQKTTTLSYALLSSSTL